MPAGFYEAKGMAPSGNAPCLRNDYTALSEILAFRKSRYAGNPSIKPGMIRLPANIPAAGRTALQGSMAIRTAPFSIATCFSPREIKHQPIHFFQQTVMMIPKVRCST